MELFFVLVEPARPENVGAAARALKTMGFARLRLVNACDLSREARWVAHESTELLDQAQHYSSLADALADIDFSIASSAGGTGLQAGQTSLNRASTAGSAKGRSWVINTPAIPASGSAQ